MLNNKLGVILSVMVDSAVSPRGSHRDGDQVFGGDVETREQAHRNAHQADAAQRVRAQQPRYPRRRLIDG